MVWAPFRLKRSRTLKEREVSKHVATMMETFTQRFAAGVPLHSLGRYRMLEEIRHGNATAVHVCAALEIAETSSGLQAAWATKQLPLLFTVCRRHAVWTVTHFSKSSWDKRNV